MGKIYCTECGAELDDSVKFCSKCGNKLDKTINSKSNELKEDIDFSNKNSIKTKHIDKNGFSFEYPEYYDIGKYPSSDEAHKSIVALSKNDRKCELYVMAYKRSKFDNNAKRNINLLKRYLQLFNYKNITINKKLPYCFNANVSHNMGTIKTTIAFNFDQNDVIMVVGNVVPSSNYDCIEDMKIILDTLQYNNLFKLLKRVSPSKTMLISGAIFILTSFITAISYVMDPTTDNEMAVMILVSIIMGLICTIPTFIIVKILIKYSKNHKKTLKDTCFYWEDGNNDFRLSKTKIISWLMFILSSFILTIYFMSDPYDGIVLIGAVMDGIIVGLICAFPTFIIGYLFHVSKKRLK